MERLEGLIEMEVRLKGIGALPELSMKVDGLTVITGVNNTGKSTILKSIFVLADAAGCLDRDIRREILFSAEMLYSQYYIRRSKEDKTLINEFIAAIKKHDTEKVDQILDTIKPDENKMRADRFRLENSSYFAERVKYIREYASNTLDRTVFFERFVKDNVVAEFNNQIRNIKTNKPAKIEFFKNGKGHGVSIGENDDVTIHGKILDYNRCPVYIDTPYMFDRICDGESFFRGGRVVENHENKLATTLEPVRDSSAIERISIDEKIKNIEVLIKKVLSGTFKSTRNGTLYEVEGIRLNAKSIATGMKTFSLIKMLIESGQVGEGSIVMIDEPEAHVHPQWQLILAEALVLMNKDMRTNIIISTHSPQMLLAIEAFSLKHQAHVDYYNTHRDDRGNIAFENVNNKLEKVYGPMADAYDKADELYWGSFIKSE